MTPKEKATELLAKMDVAIYSSDGHMADEDAGLNCAKIVADEAIKLANLMDGGFSFKKEIEYWQDVRAELEPTYRNENPTFVKPMNTNTPQ